MYQFKERIESQVEYYELFKRWLKRRDSIVEVWDADLADDLKGTDIFIRTNKEDVLRIQVKVDHIADVSGNIPIETVSQAYANRDSVIGSEFNMSHVDYIFFILSKTKRIYGYKFSRLMEYVIGNYEKFRNYGANNSTYRTLGCLVPMRQIEHLVTHEGSLFEIEWEDNFKGDEV